MLELEKEKTPTNYKEYVNLESNINLQTNDFNSLSIVQENAAVINQIREELEQQKQHIKTEGDTIFNILSLQSILVIPIFSKTFFLQFFSNFVSSFLALGLIGISLVFLLLQFKLREVQQDEESWYFRFLPKRRKIRVYKELKNNYQESLYKLSSSLANSQTQALLFSYLEENKKFVPVEKIQLYNVGIHTLQDYLSTQHYKEALDLVSDLFNDINPQYVNPYFNSTNKFSEFKKNAQHYFKKYL